jgi:hypothetical protein
MSTAAFAQTDDQPKAVKFDEFETAANGFVKWRMDAFYVELSNNPASQGYIINYGTDREIMIREKQIRVSIQWRKFDATRITFVRGGLRETVKTELWQVPPGAENPQPDSSAAKTDEFGKINEEEFKARIDNFYTNLGDKPDFQGYILLYGSPKLVAAQDARIRKYLALRKLDLTKVTIKNAGTENTGRTEFWMVPAKNKTESKTKIYIDTPGAKPPTP